MEFLDSLPVKDAAKVFQTIQMLEEFGPALPFPYSSQIEGKLRELGTRLGRNLYMILYYADKKRRFVRLHGFRKTSEKLPESIKLYP